MFFLQYNSAGNTCTHNCAAAVGKMSTMLVSDSYGGEIPFLVPALTSRIGEGPRF